MINVTNQVAFLRTSRDFPEDLHQLTIEVNKMYIDVANAVNNRTISIFPTTRPAQTGENYFLVANQRQNSLRQVYTFGAIVNGDTIPIGFKLSSISQILPSIGDYTDGTSWYGLIFGSTVSIGGQISFYVTVNGASTQSDNIVFVVDAGAPAITSGLIVLNWLSRV
jgi:hypothetical protein